MILFFLSLFKFSSTVLIIFCANSLQGIGSSERARWTNTRTISTCPSTEAKWRGEHRRESKAVTSSDFRSTRAIAKPECPCNAATCSGESLKKP